MQPATTSLVEFGLATAGASTLALCKKMKTIPDIQSRITLADGVITFTSNFYPSWNMRIDDLRLFGESTNQNGPFADDYFLCFATDSSGWQEASFYSDGTDEFLNELAKILGIELTLGLTFSTDFVSRILWPEVLIGEPMFTFTDVPPKTLIGRIFGSFRNTQTFSNQALSLLVSKKHNKSEMATPMSASD